MEDGLYETLITRPLAERLRAFAPHAVVQAPLDNADAPEILARHVAEELERALHATKNTDARLALVNRLLESIEVSETVDPPARQLQSVWAQKLPHLAPEQIQRPRTPLSDAALLTNAKGDPSLGAELRAEIPFTRHFYRYVPDRKSVV